jgi:TolB-like protein
MASIIPGFEYDIFISYRQKDNKGDRWVSEFVDALKTELESTFKEDVSVYFDINPNDGLLETHDVDASLVEKLKCLVFIPIISRTYCDPKSFAWENEFKSFINQASHDQFGLKIKLPNGNVANRVLPVQIHILAVEDKSLLEKELGGDLRAIEFVYKSAGVNRPLRTNEDLPQDNLNKTYYRDQINKVANAVKDIIASIKNKCDKEEEVLSHVIKQEPEKSTRIKPKNIFVYLSALVLILLGYFFVHELFKSTVPVDKSIAVLPFKLLSDEPDKQYMADGMMDAILLHLSKIKDLRVLPRVSSEQYRETTKSAHDIGQELDVTYLLEGSFQKFGDNVRLIVQLINAKEESHEWANEYNSQWTDIFSVQREVAQTIARELNTVITIEEKKRIERIPTSNLNAYDLYMKASGFQKDYFRTFSLSSYQKAVTFYKAALELDSAFARAYSGLAWTYGSRYYWESYLKENFLDSCLLLVNTALTLDNQLDEGFFLRGEYYRLNGNVEEALDNFDEALKINPNYYQAYSSKGYILTIILYDYVRGIDNYNKALNLIRGDERPSLLRILGRAYLDAGFIDKAKSYYEDALALDGKKADYYDNIAWVEFNLENYEEALNNARRCLEIDSTHLMNIMFYSIPEGHNDEAYKHAKKVVESYEKSKELNLIESHRVGYAYWQAGKHKEAEKYFNDQIRYSENSIKLNRIISQRKAAQYDLAATYAFLGKREMAYQYLNEFDKQNSYPLWWVSLAKNDPLFGSIRNEEQFKKILQNMESKYQAEHERVRKWLEENRML